MSPVRCSQIKAHEIHHSKELDKRISLAVALITIQVTVDLAQFHPNFEGEHHGGGQIDSKFDSDGVQKLLDSHNQELTIHGFIGMHE
ncbi:hypothetical protein TNCV_5027591 [Trichonephila clavipes]|nr:hypothetical protein TNCV_5027591 [Trichonephila clavipes]